MIRNWNNLIPPLAPNGKGTRTFAYISICHWCSTYYDPTLFRWFLVDQDASFWSLSLSRIWGCSQSITRLFMATWSMIALLCNSVWESFHFRAREDLLDYRVNVLFVLLPAWFWIFCPSLQYRKSHGYYTYLIHTIACLKLIEFVLGLYQ